MKTGGPRLDATEKSAAGSGADSSAGTVQAGDKSGTTTDWKLAGAATCPPARAQIAQVACEAGSSACNWEWNCSSTASTPNNNNRKAISPAITGRHHPALSWFQRGMDRISAGAMPFDKAYAPEIAGEYFIDQKSGAAASLQIIDLNPRQNLQPRRGCWCGAAFPLQAPEAQPHPAWRATASGFPAGANTIPEAGGTTSNP